MHHDGEKDDDCCVKFVVTITSTALIFAAPWLIYTIGLFPAMMIKLTSQYPLPDCKSDSSTCGAEPIFEDWFFSALLQLIGLGIEACVIDFNKLKPIPIISAILHFSGVAPFCLTALFSAFRTTNYEHHSTDTMKWVEHYYLRYGLGLALIVIIIIAIITLCFLPQIGQSILSELRIRLRQTGNLIRRAGNHCLSTRDRHTEPRAQLEENYLTVVRRYMRALCCRDRGRFEESTGELAIEEGKRKKERIPSDDLQSVRELTETYTEAVCSIHNINILDPEPQQPVPAPPSFCQRLSCLFSCSNPSSPTVVITPSN